MKWLLLTLMLLCSCVPTITPTPITITPTPTPFISPPPTPTPFVSPLALATPISTPTPAPRIITASVTNPSFELGGWHPVTTVQELETGVGWYVWWDDKYKCKAGADDCDLPCPSNCQRLDGQCYGSDPGCWWARPETNVFFGKASPVNRAFEGQWSQRGFSWGRMSNSGIWQKVGVKQGAVVTASMWVDTWQCYKGPDCRLSHMNLTRTVDLLSAWGIAGPISCPGPEVCTWPASDVSYFLKPENSRFTDIPPSMNVRIGIHPSGAFTGTRWSGKYDSNGNWVWLQTNLNDVVWSDPTDCWDRWCQVVVTTTAQSPTITVVTAGSPRFAFSHAANDWYIDKVEVVYQELPQHLIYLPLVVR